MEKVLCPTDFSEPATAGIGAAAERFPEVEIVLLHVVDRELIDLVSQFTGLDSEELATKAWNYADVRLSEAASALLSRGRRARGVLLSGEPPAETIRLATEEKVSLIVLGTSIHRKAMTSASERFRTILAAHCPVPVLLVPLLD